MVLKQRNQLRIGEKMVRVLWKMKTTMMFHWRSHMISACNQKQIFMCHHNFVERMGVHWPNRSNVISARSKKNEDLKRTFRKILERIFTVKFNWKQLKIFTAFILSSFLMTLRQRSLFPPIFFHSFKWIENECELTQVLRQATGMKWIMFWAKRGE